MNPLVEAILLTACLLVASGVGVFLLTKVFTVLFNYMENENGKS